MEKKEIIIIVVLTIIIASLLSYIIIDNGKTKNALVWCNTKDPFDVITGEIIKISNGSSEQNQTGNILIEQKEGKGAIIVHHNSDIKFEIGQKIKVAYSGDVRHSNPPQTIAICIEIVE